MNHLITLKPHSPTPDNRLPVVIAQGDPDIREKFVQYFMGEIANSHTRRAYVKAIYRFLDWCHGHSPEPVYDLKQVRPLIVSLYIRGLEAVTDEKGKKLFSDSTVKLQLAAIRKFFDYLVVQQVVPQNPAASVKGPKIDVEEGKTPVLTRKEARILLDNIDTSIVVGLRDRALIATMIFSFARIGGVLNMSVKDYYKQGDNAYIHLKEKRGKRRVIPAHYKMIEFLDEYITVSGIAADPDGPLFRSSNKSRSRDTLTDKRLTQRTALKIIKRRARDVGLPEECCNHTFRGTGITAYLESGGDIETAAKIAGHASTRTTQLYNRSSKRIPRDEIFRISL